MLRGNNQRLKEDLSFMVVGLFVAVLLWQNNTIDHLLVYFKDAQLLSAFIAGLCFTSGFTTLPAVAFMIKITQFAPPWMVAILGSMGAVVGDAILFYFFRERLTNDFFETLKKSRLRRVKHFFKSKIIRFSFGLASTVLIALPLPTDEAAFALMGASRFKTYTFILIAFVANFAAIYLITTTTLHFTG